MWPEIHNYYNWKLFNQLVEIVFEYGGNFSYIDPESWDTEELPCILLCNVYSAPIMISSYNFLTNFHL